MQSFSLGMGPCVIIFGASYVRRTCIQPHSSSCLSPHLFVCKTSALVWVWDPRPLEFKSSRPERRVRALEVHLSIPWALRPQASGASRYSSGTQESNASLAVAPRQKMLTRSKCTSLPSHSRRLRRYPSYQSRNARLLLAHWHVI